MKRLLKPVFQSIVTKKEILLFLSCAFYPLLIALVSLFQAGIADYAEGQPMSFITFWRLIVQTQWQLTIPTLLLSYGVMSVFSNDILSKRLFLFKDIERPLIFKVKVYNLLKILMLFIAGTFVTTLACYYTFMLPRDFISGHLFPETYPLLINSLLAILSRIAVYMIVILLVANLAIRYNVVVSVLGGVLFMLFSNIAPQLTFGKFLFPTGYTELGNSAIISLAGIVMISGSYCFLFYWLGIRAFERVEY